MLRWLLVALVFANLAVWAWTQPQVSEALGLHALDPQREPERLNRQVNPQALRLVQVNGQAAPQAQVAASGASAAAAEPPPPAASGASAPAQAASSSAAEGPVSCLQAGPVGDQALAELTRQLQLLGLRSDRWVDMRRELPGRWALYMGRFADAEALQRKIEEVRRMKLPHEELANHPTLSPGLTLGQFASEAEAQAKLAQLQQRGVRTARVVALIEPVAEHRLRVEGLTPELATQLKELRPDPGWGACSAR